VVWKAASQGQQFIMFKEAQSDINFPCQPDQGDQRKGQMGRLNKDGQLRRGLGNLPKDLYPFIFEIASRYPYPKIFGNG
jgi:hypothetical protein